MDREVVQPPGIARPRAPYSPVVVSGDLVVTAGQVAFDEGGDLVPGGIREQTAQVLDNLAACLGAAGCTFDDVVKVTAFLADLADFEAFNDVYGARFATAPPARSTVGVALPGGILVEIEAIARMAIAGEGSAIG
jgi:2-iminobutanoate/2-iminopropanoate deaminase